VVKAFGGSQLMFIKVLAVIYVLYGLGLVFAGLIVAAVICIGAAYLSWTTGAWWPLVVAFALGWLLRLLGLDPGWRR
jgi:hypothetical protein